MLNNQAARVSRAAARASTGGPAGPGTDAVLRALDYMPYGFACFDRDGRLEFANRRLPEILDTTPDTLPQGLPLDAFYQVGFGGALDEPEFDCPTGLFCGVHRLASGRAVRCESEFVPGGGIAVTVSDVTAERATETVLRKSEARFRDLTEISSDWFWEKGTDYRFTFISERFEKLSGVSLKDLIGQRRGESPYVIEGQNELIEANHEAMRRRETFRDFRFEIVDGWGQRRVLSVDGAPFYDDKGDFAGYRGTGSDITDVTRISEELEARRAQIEELMAHAPLPIFFKDRNLRFVLANPAFYRDRNLTPKQVIGKTSEEIYPASGGQAFMQHDRDAIASKDVLVREHTIGPLFVRSYKFPVFDNDGRLLGLGGVELDMTERIRESHALAAAKNEAERANKAKSYFLAKVSHELRTPLNAVIGFGDMLKSEIFGPLGNARYHGYAGDIVSSGQHLLGLVSDILDISKIESNELILTETEIDLSALVLRAAMLTEASRDRPHATIATHRVRRDLKIVGDQTALERIVMNLIGNALKFTEIDGRVDLSLEQGTDGTLVLKIRDSGVGIAADKLSEVVQPFSTGANPLSLNYEGAGLGLAIVKALCDAHQAEFDIESREGEGTQCKVTFPPSRTL